MGWTLLCTYHSTLRIIQGKHSNTRKFRVKFTAVTVNTDGHCLRCNAIHSEQCNPWSILMHHSAPKISSAKEPYPYVPQIGPGPRDLPDVGLRYPIWGIQHLGLVRAKFAPWIPRSMINPQLRRLHALRNAKGKKKCRFATCPTHMYLLYLGSIQSKSQIRLYLGSKWLATTHPTYPR